jgi:glycosyltransferase 2 family protein
MSPRTRRIAGLLAGLVIVGFLAGALIGGWQQVSDYDWELRPGWLVGGVALVVLQYLLFGLAYVALVERLVERRVNRHRMLEAWARSLLGRYVPGNVLMVASRAVLAGEAGVPMRVALAAIVYEQVLVVAAAAVASLAFLALYGGEGQAGWIWLVGVVPVMLVLLDPRVFRRISTWILARAGREPLQVLLSTRQVAAFFALYGVMALLLGLGVWALVHSAAGADAGGPLFVGLAFLLSFVVSMIAFVFPSGLGVREGVLAVALARNVPFGVGVALAAGVRLVLTIVEVAFVGIVALMARRRGAPGARSPTAGRASSAGGGTPEASEWDRVSR